MIVTTNIDLMAVVQSRDQLKPGEIMNVEILNSLANTYKNLSIEHL